jgi:hypothetical protein
MGDFFELAQVLSDQLNSFLELRRSVAALIVVMEKSDPQFRKRYEEALAGPAVAESAQINSQWFVMAQRAFDKLRKKN